MMNSLTETLRSKFSSILSSQNSSEKISTYFSPIFSSVSNHISHFSSFVSRAFPHYSSIQHNCDSDSVLDAYEIPKSSIRRDFPFTVGGGEILLFSRKNSDLESFGVKFQQRLQYSLGGEQKVYTVVVGVRQALLWVVDDGESVAHPLSEAYNAEDLWTIYRLSVVFQENSASSQQLVQPVALPKQWTHEVVEFLATAPELFLSVSMSSNFLTLIILSPCCLENEGNSKNLGEKGWTLGWGGAQNVFLPNEITKSVTSEISDSSKYSHNHSCKMIKKDLIQSCPGTLSSEKTDNFDSCPKICDLFSAVLSAGVTLLSPPTR